MVYKVNFPIIVSMSEVTAVIGSLCRGEITSFFVRFLQLLSFLYNVILLFIPLLFILPFRYNKTILVNY